MITKIQELKVNLGNIAFLFEKIIPVGYGNLFICLNIADGYNTDYTTVNVIPAYKMATEVITVVIDTYPT